MDRFISQFSHWNTSCTQNVIRVLKQNSFILECSCTTRECAIQKKSFRFVSKCLGLTPKIQLEHTAKMQLCRGNPSIHVIIRGVSPKISMLLLPLIYCIIACFHECLVLALWKLVTQVTKACRFQLWQSICYQSNPWPLTFK